MDAQDPEDRFHVLQQLPDRLRGEVLVPGTDGYDDARRLWNDRIDRRPAAIARCAGTGDVIACVEAVRSAGWPLAVKGGGHHVSGAALHDGGLVIDLSPMDAVRVEPGERRVHVQGGARWGSVDRASQAYGLATPGSQDPTVGVGGLTLGGGVGWLSPKFGLTSDNLRSAEVVTADGEVVRTDDSRRPELFWALRGGGGHLGVVTEFEFELHEVGPEILAGSLIHPLEDAVALIRSYRSFIEAAPREVRPLLGIMELPETDYYPPSVHGERVALLILFYGGDPEVGERILEPIRSFGEPLMDSVRPRSYLDWQQVGESHGHLRVDLRSQFVETLSDEVMAHVVEQARVAPSAESTVFISPRRGAETDPPVNATAYPHRSDAHHILIEARWSDRKADVEHQRWVREFAADLRPFTTGAIELNFLTGDEERGRGALGSNLDRVRRVKASWDPDNVFGVHPGLVAPDE